MIDQGELFSIPNPCRGICQVNNKGYCKGCFRSRKERFHWQEFSPFQRQLVINACEKRRQRVLAAQHAHETEEVVEAQSPQLLLLPEDSSLDSDNTDDHVEAENPLQHKNELKQQDVVSTKPDKALENNRPEKSKKVANNTAQKPQDVQQDLFG